MAKKKKKKTIIEQLSKKVTTKKILKTGQATVTIKEKKPSNIFHEENRFFKSELSKAKQEMFA